ETGSNVFQITIGARLLVVAPAILHLRLVVEELGDVVAEDELEVADGAVALLADDDLGDALLLGILVVDLVAVDEGHEVGVLLDRSRLAEVGELWTVVA